MKIIKLKDKDFSICSSWYDINITKFNQIRKLQEEKESMDLFDYNMKFIEIITDMSRDELERLNIEDFGILLQELLTITSEDIKPIEHVIIDIDKQYYVMDKTYNTMMIAQGIDIDKITKEGDAWDNAHKICASFIRKGKLTNRGKVRKILGRKLRVSDFNIQEYSWDELQKDSEIFLNKLPIPYIYNCMTFFFQAQREFKQAFVGLFNTKPPEEEDKDKPVTKTLLEEYSARWNWYALILELSGNDLGKFEQVLRYRMVDVFNYLAYKKETEDYKRHINKNNK